MEIMKALNNKEIVAMLIDRYSDGLDSITTNFLINQHRFPGTAYLKQVNGRSHCCGFRC